MSKPANYYVIVKRDFTRTKSATAVQPAFTDRRNALEAMEDYAFGFVADTDGMEYAKRCLFDESMYMSFLAAQLSKQTSDRAAKFLEASLKERETEMKEQGFSRLDNGKFNPNEGCVLSEKRFLRKVANFPKKHFITRDVESSVDRLTVWRKYDVEKTVPGRVWGTKVEVNTVVEKQFSVEVITVPFGVLRQEHKHPNVTYKSEWYRAVYLPKDMTEDQYIEKGRKELAKDVSACLEVFSCFEYLGNRFKDEEDIFVYDDAEPLNLPRIRYEFADEFAILPCAQKYDPNDDIVPDVEEIPLNTETEDAKDNIPE